ncbi:unnamed protein product [Hyaloperonospora brassicae]|uniref:Uncharacterized protein n=1 Tax=Hyaloperonospora brassicae TaxID=162125 RepID=A0AAV0TNM9_HYABA|nr:unnamed protein product [Hyaloperonospora brassicae]
MGAKRHAPFRSKYGVELALRVRDRDPETNEVLTATCMFCQSFGRENKAGALRRPTDKVAVFKPPFRKDAIQIHHVGQHAARWAAYCALLSDDTRRAFFTSADEAPDGVALLSTETSGRPVKTTRRAPHSVSKSTSTSRDRGHQRHVPVMPQPLRPTRHWVVDRDIVTVVIGTFVPHASAVITAGRTYLLHAVADFQDLVDETESGNDHPAADRTAARFRIVVAHPTQFQQFIDLLSASESLTTSATMLRQQTSKESVPGSPSLDTEGMESLLHVADRYARFLCAINFQQMADIVSSTGVRSIGLQVGPMAPALVGETQVLYCVHLQLRVFANGEVTSFHVLSMLVDDCHSLATDGLGRVFDTTEAVLDVIVPRWQDLVLAVVIETEGTMDHEAGDLRTVLCNAAIGRFEPVLKPGSLKLCCAARQLDSLMQSFFSEIVGGEAIYTKLTTLVAYVSRQRALLSTIKTDAPAIGDNRWRSIASVTMWFRRYSASIRAHLKTHRATCSPPDTWWIRVILAARVSQEVLPILLEMSSFSAETLFRRDAVVKLRAFVIDWFSISGPPESNKSAVAAGTGRSETNTLVVSQDGKYSVSIGNVFAALEDLGSSTADILRATKSEDDRIQALFETTLNDTAASVVGLVAGLTSVVTGMDGVGAMVSRLPAVLPQDLVNLRGRQFTAAVLPQMERLRVAGWTPQEIEWIEQDFQDLRGAYFCEASLKLALASCVNKHSVHDSWGCLQGRFTHLRRFCELMATAYPRSVVPFTTSTMDPLPAARR